MRHPDHAYAARVLALILTLCAACAADAEHGPAATIGEEGESGGTSWSPIQTANPGTSADAGFSGAAQASRCDAEPELQLENCPCTGKPRGACWSGPIGLRNVGDCHDGVHECIVGEEFSHWGPCVGEQRDCGTRDAGPPAPPPGDCPCVPGAVIGCDEDCSVGIICSATAEKSCLPDGTWGPCRETVDGGIGSLLNGGNVDLGTLLAPTATVDLSSLGSLDTSAAFGLATRCRSYFFGCADGSATNILTRGFAGFQETYMGDCSKQFSCGHAPAAR
jgi:hypothetical protein